MSSNYTTLMSIFRISERIIASGTGGTLLFPSLRPGARGLQRPRRYRAAPQFPPTIGVALARHGRCRGRGAGWRVRGVPGPDSPAPRDNARTDLRGSSRYPYLGQSAHTVNPAGPEERRITGLASARMATDGCAGESPALTPHTMRRRASPLRSAYGRGAASTGMKLPCGHDAVPFGASCGVLRSTALSAPPLVPLVANH